MLHNFRQFWAGLRRRGRIGFVLGIVAIVGLSAGLAYWSLGTRYKTLFADLQMRDSAAIVGELARLKVPYKLADGGRRILVPEDDVYPTRLKLMGKGIPLSGGVGFEIFDKNDFGMTEFAQRINYQRALQGELARTIRSIQGVKFARVQLVLPQTSLFKENKTKPKASIGLIVADGTTLDGNQVLGIQRLVASAVPGLSAQHVTIVNQRGVTLSKTTSTTTGDLSASDKLDVKRRIEKYLESKIVAVLDRTFGKSKAIVSVDATLDMDDIKTTEESMVPVSRTKSGLGVGGLIRRRTVINRSSPPILTDATEKSHGTRSSARPRNATSEVEYKFGRKVEQIISTPGSVRRLSVGVLVPYEMTPERLSEIRRLVAVTVGFDKSRGDEIAIYPAMRYARASDGKGVGDVSALAANAVKSSIRPAAAAGGAPHQPPAETASTSKNVPASTGAAWLGRLVGAWRALGFPYDYVVAVVGGVLLVGLGALLAVLLIPRRTPDGKRTTRGLSESERDELLRQLQEWLETEGAESEQGVTV